MDEWKSDRSQAARRGQRRRCSFLSDGCCPPIGHDYSAGLGQSSPTTPGLIVGTVKNMSPEQMGGKEVDAPTDIFAFGAVLYEMVTGRQAFEGETPASVISAIMSAHPPRISGLNHSLRRRSIVS